MKYVSRLTGKPLKFKNKEQYEAHLADLKGKGLLKIERSRRVGRDIARNAHWKAVHAPLSMAPNRFDNVPVDPPAGHKRQTISLVHPTRGRPAPCRQCMYMWLDYCSKHNHVEYIVSLDDFDAPSYLPVLREMVGQFDVKLVINDNKTMVQALNVGAQQATGDILIYVSDDFECFPNWDLAIQQAVGDQTDWCLAVYDNVQKEYQTICILSREYYERFGYIYYPEYISMWVDPDYTEVAKRLGKLIDGMHLTFKHNHFITPGGMPLDETYKRQNSHAFWVQGDKLFRERKARNFDV